MENMPVENQLGNCTIWIIDDEIPLTQITPRDELMLTGERPVDRGTLRMLLMDHVKWGDHALQHVCEQLVDVTGSILAFPQPIAAINYMINGRGTPDLIIFDWEYKNIGNQRSDELIKQLMKLCPTVILVYTARDPEVVEAVLQPLRCNTNSRLEAACNKGNTNADLLIRIMNEKLKTSLSARLANRVRKSVGDAVERVLVKIDDLPLDLALKFLMKDQRDQDDGEIVELVSEKISEAVKSSASLVEAVSVYVEEKGIPQEKAVGFVEEMVELIATNVRERLQYDGWLQDVIQQCWENYDENKKYKDESTKNIIREFFAFRLYEQPTDKIVRTGDIVELRKGNFEQPDLYMILTPPCDLARFWKSTGGILTIIKLRPIISNCGTQFSLFGKSAPSLESITSEKSKIILPSLPINEISDYFMSIYEISSIMLNGERIYHEREREKKRVDPGFNMGDKYWHKLPVTYDDFEMCDFNLRRKCRISEPFLSGILTQIANHMFRMGVPNIPEIEQDRLKVLFDKK